MLPPQTSSLMWNPGSQFFPSLGKLPSTSQRKVSFSPAPPAFPINISNLVVLSVNLNDSRKVLCAFSLPGSLKGHYSNLTPTELSQSSQVWRGSGYPCCVCTWIDFSLLSNSYWEAVSTHPHTFVLAHALSEVPEDWCQWLKNLNWP